MKYNLAIRKNNIMLSVATWMGLEHMMLNGVSQKERNRYKVISLRCGTQNNKVKKQPILKAKRNQELIFSRKHSTVG